MIIQCQTAVKELGGRHESFLNTTQRQNQLWFPVTSLVQYVHAEQCESKGGHDQQEESKTFAKIDDSFLIFHCNRNRDIGT